MRYNSILCMVAVLCLAVSSRPAVADDPLSKLVDSKLPLVVSTPASGFWYKRHPFDPKLFAATRGFAPASQVESKCVAVFIDGLDDERWARIKILDELLSQAEFGDQSYVNIFDTKGAQLGGYTTSELEARLAEIREKAEQLKLEKISLGIAASTEPTLKHKFGIDQHDDMTVLLIQRNQPKREVIVLGVRAFKFNETSQLSFQHSIEALLKQ